MNEEQIKQLIRSELADLIRAERYTFQKHIQILDGRNIQTGRTTGTKIGTATDQKIGFYGATPVTQQADINALTDNTGGTANDTLVAISGSGDDANINNNFADLVDQVNGLRTAIRNLGLMA